MCIDRARRGEQPGSLSLFLLLSFYLSFFLLLSLSHSLHTATPCESVHPPTYTMFRPCTTFSSLGDRSFFSLPRKLPPPSPMSTSPRRSAVVSADQQTPTANYRRPGEPIPTSSTSRNLMSLFFFLPLFLSFSLLFSLSFFLCSSPRVSWSSICRISVIEVN